ncbi:MAG TPA: hypothetical protein VMR70_16320 [Flavisolibacter sp.]|nr:hypothetical protein [Flavisolibacter sp.]
MKLFKILSHPYTLIFCFLFMLISGQHLGGFYALYILLGLYHGVLHSLLGFFGIAILFLSYHLLKKKKTMQVILNVVGVILLFASVFFFFKNDKEHYNWGTFEQVVPMFTIVLTAFIGLCFLLGNFWKPHLSSDIEQNFLSKV